LLESIVVFHCTSLADSALIAILTHCHIFLGNFDEDSDNDFPEESDLDDTVMYGGIWVLFSCGKGGLNSYFCYIVVPCCISNVRREKGIRALLF
jgi:hypothetical protein